ncbi:hypothetical protein [uncultured Enterovirga sp.]|uniref:hypothetical protein n=1 Tax=uncultured Enterovirga sp. TaxID=2026352 RepID=UPI0035CAB3A9
MSSLHSFTLLAIEIPGLRSRIARLERMAAGRTLNADQVAFIAGLKAQLASLTGEA